MSTTTQCESIDLIGRILESHHLTPTTAKGLLSKLSNWGEMIIGPTIRQLSNRVKQRMSPTCSWWATPREPEAVMKLIFLKTKETVANEITCLRSYGSLFFHYGTFESETKTQVRLFAQNDAGAFTPIRVFDCPACDINELTIITKSQDDPVHELPREIADTGVKFAAWGKDFRSIVYGRRPPGKALVREVLAASAGISAAVFFDDYSMLLIGDATSKIHILSRKEDDSEFDDLEGDSVQHGTQKRNQFHLRTIKHHPEPPPPIEYKEQSLETGVEISKELIRQGFISLHKDRAIGVIQSPNYSEPGLDYCYAHIDNDPSQPLLSYYEVQQQEHRKLHVNLEPDLIVAYRSDLSTHLQNLSLDVDLEALDQGTRTSLSEDKVEVMGDFMFEHELTPRYETFKRFRGSRQSTRVGDSLDEQQEQYVNKTTHLYTNT
ncbi:WD repeat domain-containing protein [Rutstroemia sp. NJR-2017a BBW]|nr:WD repeat domain-containing protein [Rutstroemia sp. NJR-2017a BBW]